METFDETCSSRSRRKEVPFSIPSAVHHPQPQPSHPQGTLEGEGGVVESETLLPSRPNDEDGQPAVGVRIKPRSNPGSLSNVSAQSVADDCSAYGLRPSLPAKTQVEVDNNPPTTAYAGVYVK
jgi:hypothetical protein